MKLSKTVIDAAERHARAEFPKEACGLIAVVKGRRRYFPCKNLSTEGEDRFEIDPQDYARVEDLGEIVGVFHSHPNASANPSEADRLGCEASGVVWYILGLPSGVWVNLKPSGYTVPLVGREFVHGVLDCYTLIRDWYRHERGVTLPDFQRKDEWWVAGENLYVDNFESAGFQIVDGLPEEGDVLLMQVCSNVPNHGAIYLGNDQIVHHLYGRLSSREVYGGYYKKHTTHILRYVGK